jgi:hypothetical protein
MSRSRNDTGRGSARSVRVALVTVGIFVASVSVAAAHDMFVKPASFFVAPNGETLIRVLNGTFSVSENSIARPRVGDLSVLSSSGRFRMDTSAWSAAGDTSTFRFRAGASGTYVLGVSTRANMIEMSADTFDLYLKEDGIPDELEARRRAPSNRRVSERYSKHVKAFVQVGDTRTDAYATPLGYPAELIPLSNPYTLKVGDVLRVRTLVDGKPAANQYVLYGGRTSSQRRIQQKNVRSDAEGVASIPITSRGTWYVKFINMARLSNDPAAQYESKWATITFQLR